jgi:hypothetical protein
MFHPIFQCRQIIHRIRPFAAARMGHAGNHEQPAKLLRGLRATHGAHHHPVVIHGAERLHFGVVPALKNQQFSAIALKLPQIRVEIVSERIGQLFRLIERQDIESNQIELRSWI